jgi:aprataxin
MADAAPARGVPPPPPATALPPPAPQPPPESPPLIVLVGLQGAGKSTFAAALQGRAGAGGGGTLRWTRVCQDVIAGPGRRGTRAQCVAAAAAALRRGEGVIIDRTNVTAEQRFDFLAAARAAGAPAHCVFLDLPAAACAARAAGRAAHEGGVQGPGARRIVGMAARALAAEPGPPSAREGFASVLICRSDADAAAAVEAWAAWRGAGGSGADPAAEFARARPGAGARAHTLEAAWRRGGAASSAVAAAAAPPRPQRAATPPAPPLQQQRQRPRRQANAFDVLMAGAALERGRAAGPAPAPPRHLAAASPTAAAAAPRSRHTFPRTPAVNALATIADRPEAAAGSAAVLSADDRCVLLLDAYPKARAHALVVARVPHLAGPLDLTAADAPLVRHMAAVGRAWAAARVDAPDGFRLGFHACPSMRRLHLHVVSRDLDAPALKMRHHWNSFTLPEFFLDAERVLAALEGPAGALAYDPAAAKAAVHAAPPRCHRCGAVLPSIPALKAHVGACAAPLPPLG